MKKEIYLPYFKDKKVTVMGLGLLGRGVGDTAFLANCGAKLIVTDKKTKKELISSLETLKSYEDIVYVLGEHRLIDFEGRDFILEAAGVPYDSEYLIHAKKNNIPVYMSASFLCDIVMKNLERVTIIGITGTRGKTTTTQLIRHVLEISGRRVHLGGNIRGVANLPLLSVVEDGDYLVLELDSWQLQGFGELNISPKIAVFTSFLDDHLNYYHGDKKSYFNDKSNIYKYQKEDDVLITSAQAREEINKYDKKRKMIVPGPIDFDMKIIGDHNKIIAGIAYEVASHCGLEEEVIKDAIKSFSGVEGRLQDMGVFHGVRVFNDNNATTPDATVKAIESINKKYNKKPIIIIGGSDKGLALDVLEKEIITNTQIQVLLKGTGTEKLNINKKHIYEKLSDCVNKAFDLAKEGDIILFSPAFASFSKDFNNEYEKNDEFVRLIKNYATT